MILAINIGNSNITLGGFEEDALCFKAQLYSDFQCSMDEYAVKLDSIFKLYHIESPRVEGAILSSVVPVLTGRISDALKQLFPIRVLHVGPGLKSGVPIRIDNPSELGGELLCATVAALELAPAPLVVIHMDTAISMMAVNRSGQLVGGVIIPGPQLALNSLVHNTAQLPQVNLRRKPAGILSTNTADCLQSGVVLGTAAQIDGLIRQFRAAIGEDVSVVATGNFLPVLRNACESEIQYKETLILDGMYAIWKKNQK